MEENKEDLEENKKIDDIKKISETDISIEDIAKILYADEKMFIKLYEENFKKWKEYADGLYQSRLNTIINSMPDFENFNSLEKIEILDDKLKNISVFITDLNKNLNNFAELAETLKKLPEITNDAVILTDISPKYSNKLKELFTLLKTKQIVDKIYITNIESNYERLLSTMIKIDAILEETKNV